MLLYAISRFIIEFYRGDERGTVGMFSTSQFISYPARAAGDRHARLSLAGEDAGTQAGQEGRLTANAAPVHASRARSRILLSAMPTQTLTVPEDSDGTRLDRFLASALALSRSQLQRLIKTGGAGRGPSRKSQPGGQAGSGNFNRRARANRRGASPENLPLPIVYQDADLIVVDKPAGMVVHPAAGHASGTLVNALLHHVDDLSGIGGEKRPASCIGSTAARRG